MKPLPQTILVVLILALGGCAAWLLLSNPRTPEREEPVLVLPGVRVMRVERTRHTPILRSHGSVETVQQTRLAPQVAGRVIELAPGFAAGGVFAAGEVLCRLDAVDFEQALVEAQAGVARAELRVALEEREASVAKEEWDDFGEGEPDPLLLREPQLREARAELASARAGVERARRDLERTVVRAPYACTVAARYAAQGEWLTPATPVALLLATDVAEIRLPFNDDDVALLDVPRAGQRNAAAPVVELSAVFGGRRQTWTGRIVRSESEIDARTRMLTVVAQVSDPYALAGADAELRTPLAFGLFVEARVQGRALDDVFVVPREALRDGEWISVVDAEDRLQLRRVTPLHTEHDFVVLAEGLEDGERLCLTQLEVAVNDLAVRVIDEPLGAEGAR